ncbi:hypothetical protein H4Q26_017001 [Puccinia striiformis f. sp. tritici PST-130]|nr:hypothetical protein H4Q26_017001 [Puccinia striiformis f. sp. tritici PST-130]
MHAFRPPHTDGLTSERNVNSNKPAPSQRFPLDSSTAPTGFNIYPPIHYNMDPNANPSDSQPVADLPETSPGGIGPVEESLGGNPTANVERAEEAAALPPHVEHAEEEEWIELPEEMNADLDELFDLARARVVDLPPLAEVLQAVTPEQDRILFQTFFDACNQIITELTNNPQQRSYSLQEIEARVGSVDELSGIIANMDRDTAQLIGIHLNRTEEEFIRVINSPARLEMTRQVIDAFLANYTNASIPVLPSDGSQTDPPSCAICLEGYVESDVTMSLPCHSSHHFHQACILDWLQTLIPEPLTCPICRAESEALAPPNPTQLD